MKYFLTFSSFLSDPGPIIVYACQSLIDSISQKLVEDLINWPKYAKYADHAEYVKYAKYAEYTQYAEYAQYAQYAEYAEYTKYAEYLPVVFLVKRTKI